MGRHRDKDGGSKSAQKDSKKGSDSGVISTSGVPLEVGGDTHNEKPKRSQFMQDIIDDWPRNKRKGALFMDSPGVQIFLILLLQINADNSTAYDQCLKQGQLGFIYKPYGSTRGEGGDSENIHYIPI